MKKPELLAPAGNMEKLEFAIRYGADACYLGGQAYGLRAAAGNFSIEEMKKALAFAHNKGKKIYVTVNIFAHNEDLIGLPEYLTKLQHIGVDGIIVADPGVFYMAKKYCPNLSIHISTQANNTSWASAKFWEEQGANRVVLAREISIEDVQEIKKNINIEIEAFVHGAMCISYSGRCLMSNYMVGRDANRGGCAHPCRWQYYLVEEKRPNEFYPVEEDQRGTYIFNSKDMCLIEHIPELIQSGISSFKLEGRMKSVNYVATVVNAYRQAIDTYFENPEEYKVNPLWLQELTKVSNRHYFTGFYFNKPKAEDYNYLSSAYVRNYDFVGIVKDYCAKTKTAIIEERNRLQVGEELEYLSPGGKVVNAVLTKMWDEKSNQEIQVAPHPHQIVRIVLETPVEPYSLVRRAVPGQGSKEAQR